MYISDLNCLNIKNSFHRNVQNLEIHNSVEAVFWLYSRYKSNIQYELVASLLQHCHALRHVMPGPSKVNAAYLIFNQFNSMCQDCYDHWRIFAKNIRSGIPILVCVIVDIIYTYNSTPNSADVCNCRASKIVKKTFLYLALNCSVFRFSSRYNFITTSYPILLMIGWCQQISQSVGHLLFGT